MRPSLLSRLRLVCLILGLVLLLTGSGLLIGWNRMITSADSRNAEAVAALEELYPTPADAYPVPRTDNTMPTLQLSGLSLVGVLRFEGYGIALPIEDRYDPLTIHKRPARMSGSIYDSTLILGVSDRERLLSFARDLEVGQRATVTDANGKRYTYELGRVHRAERVTHDLLSEGDWDLTVFVKQEWDSQSLILRFTACPT